MDLRFASLFERAGCDGQLCVQSLDGRREIAVRADEPVVSGSVFKVSVALEAETQFGQGRLNPTDRVVLPAAQRTVGPSGFSLFDDDVEVSLLISTVITSDLRTLLDSIWQEAGFAGWTAAMAWYARPQTPERLEQVERQWRSATALTASRTTRTTPRDMATLMRLIWTDQAGPAPACARVRAIMGRQLTKHRLASGFSPPAKVSAKSGGLAGVIRNEVGVVEYPDGRSYAMAVFTQTRLSGRDAAINAVIGTAAATAVETLLDHEHRGTSA